MSNFVYSAVLALFIREFLREVNINLYIYGLRQLVTKREAFWGFICAILFYFVLILLFSVFNNKMKQLKIIKIVLLY